VVCGLLVCVCSGRVSAHALVYALLLCGQMSRVNTNHTHTQTNSNNKTSGDSTDKTDKQKKQRNTLLSSSTLLHRNVPERVLDCTTHIPLTLSLSLSLVSLSIYTLLECSPARVLEEEGTLLIGADTTENVVARWKATETRDHITVVSGKVRKRGPLITQRFELAHALLLCVQVLGVHQRHVEGDPFLGLHGRACRRGFWQFCQIEAPQ
jgi:hypothetical protein